MERKPWVSGIAWLTQLAVNLTFLSCGVNALSCMFEQESDSQTERYRWMILTEDPCKCTRIRMGGLNTVALHRPYTVEYYDTFMISDDPVEIRQWLNCPVVLPRDCSDPLLNEADSGVYTIQPRGQGPSIEVYCDMEDVNDGGGWTVFQRRRDGSVDFYRDWEDYQRGFGVLNGEFWLGNDNLHRITSQGEYELRVNMTDFDDNSVFAAYNTFSITGRRDQYRLTATGYRGTDGDSLSYHNSQPFSTRDRENGLLNCSQTYHGAWWYKDCYWSNLNGDYLGGATKGRQGVVWASYSSDSSLKTTEMKMRENN